MRHSIRSAAANLLPDSGYGLQFYAAEASTAALQRALSALAG